MSIPASRLIDPSGCSLDAQITISNDSIELMVTLSISIVGTFAWESDLSAEN